MAVKVTTNSKTQKQKRKPVQPVLQGKGALTVKKRPLPRQLKGKYSMLATKQMPNLPTFKKAKKI